MSDLKCWMCDSLGAVKRWGEITQAEAPDGVELATLWLPFRPEPPQGNIRLDRDEHVCPACRGGDNPPSEFERQIREREQRQRHVEITLDRPAGRVVRPPTGEGSAPADTPGASDPPASRT